MLVFTRELISNDSAPTMHLPTPTTGVLSKICLNQGLSYILTVLTASPFCYVVTLEDLSFIADFSRTFSSMKLVMQFSP
jgi:hypothetical protein